MAAFTPATISASPADFGHVGFDQDDFGGFFVGHFLASAFGELVDGFFALLDQRGQDGLGFFVVERGHFFDLAEVEGALDHAESGEAGFVFRFHGGDDVFLDLVGQAHGGIIDGVRDWSILRTEVKIPTLSRKTREGWGTRGYPDRNVLWGRGSGKLRDYLFHKEILTHVA